MHAKPDLRVLFLLADLSFRLGDRGRYPAPPCFMKISFRFRIKTLACMIALIAFCLACWAWTSSHGIQHVRNKYDKQLRENIEIWLESTGFFSKTVDEILNDIDTGEYFENPRSPYPFVITVETNHLCHGGHFLHSLPEQKQTHIWLFGYVSDAL